MVKKQHISFWTSMKDIQTQSEACMNLKFHANVVEAIFYKGGSYPDQQPVFWIWIEAQAGKIFRMKRKKLRNFMFQEFSVGLEASLGV
jgi:hypothetical protein